MRDRAIAGLDNLKKGVRIGRWMLDPVSSSVRSLMLEKLNVYILDGQRCEKECLHGSTAGVSERARDTKKSGCPSPAGDDSTRHEARLDGPVSG